MYLAAISGCPVFIILYSSRYLKSDNENIRKASEARFVQLIRNGEKDLSLDPLDPSDGSSYFNVNNVNISNASEARLVQLIEAGERDHLLAEYRYTHNESQKIRDTSEARRIQLWPTGSVASSRLP